MARIKGSKKTGGRKKGTKNKKTLRALLFERYLLEEVMKEKKSLVMALIEAGKKQNIKALSEILNRILGKVTEEVDIKSDGEKIGGFIYVKPKQKKIPEDSPDNKAGPGMEDSTG